LTIIPRLSTEWFVSFDVILFTTQPFYINLIHFTIGENIQKHGDRIPAVFQQPGTSRLHITTSLGSNYNFIYNTEELTSNVKHHVELDQTYYGNSVYRFNINIDGQQVLSETNSNAKQFYNVKVWASDPWYRILATNKPVISNLIFVNFL